MSLSTRRALRAKQLERKDPLVAQLADLGSENEPYVSILNSLENKDYRLSTDSELKKISSHKTDLSVITLESGTRLIARDGCEIFVPKLLRKDVIHFTLYSSCERAIMKQARGKIFCPGVCDDL